MLMIALLQERYDFSCGADILVCDYTALQAADRNVRPTLPALVEAPFTSNPLRLQKVLAIGEWSASGAAMPFQYLVKPLLS